MRIYRIAKRFTDEEIYIYHGVRPQDCRDEFGEFHAKREEMRRKAEKQAESLGHKMGPWGIMNISRCRKCGMTCSLPNINGKTDANDIMDGGGENMIGGAATQKCFVNIPDDKDYWKQSDQYYKDTFKDSDTSY